MALLDWLPVLLFVIAIITGSIFAHQRIANYLMACFAVATSTLIFCVVTYLLINLKDLIEHPENFAYWLGNLPFAFLYFYLGFIIAALVGIPFLFQRRQ